MSWDILVLKEKIDLEDAPSEIAPLGHRSDVIKCLTACIPSLRFDDESCGMLIAADYTIEFMIGRDEIIDTLSLSVRGDGHDMMNVIETVCKELGAYALDMQFTEFIDFENPSAALASWEEFQDYRDNVLELFAQEGEQDE